MQGRLIAAVVFVGFLSSCGGGGSAGDPSAPAENSDLVFESGGEPTGASAVPAEASGQAALPEEPGNETEGPDTEAAETDAQEVPASIADSVPDESLDAPPAQSNETDSAEPEDTIVPVSLDPVVLELESIPSVLEEDRTRPTSGSYSSNNADLKANGAVLFPNDGPQRVGVDRVASWPGLRFGNFLVSNNAWYASSATYPSWFQEISLVETDIGYGVSFDWDWGTLYDTAGSIFSTKSFPEVIYGTKSETERSGSFADTGLPVEIYDAPEFTIDYAFEYEARFSESDSPQDSVEIDSKFNVAIQSYFHSSCDIKRGGGVVDNGVLEMMVWLKAGSAKPAGEPPREVIVTSDGRSFDVYTKSHNPAYIAFVAQQEDLSGNIRYGELLNHVRDAASGYGIYPLKDTDCMANISIGTEIWYGASSFKLHRYTINRTY